MKKLIFFLNLIIVSSSRFSCIEGTEPGFTHEGQFGIYLSYNNELVISDKDIALYSENGYGIKLNESGLKKMRSYIDWNTNFTPPIPGTGKLYHKDFEIRLKNELIYRGKFSSLVSDMMFDGVVIYDVLMVLHQDCIWIEYNKISAPYADPRDDPRIAGYFKSLGKYTSSKISEYIPN